MTRDLLNRMWTHNRWIVLGSVVLLLLVTGTYESLRPSVRSDVANATAPTGDSRQVLLPDHLRQIADSEARPLLARLQQTQNDPALLAGIGKIYYANHDFPDAIKFYSRSVAIKEDPNVRNNLGGLYFYSGDPQSSIQQFEQVLKSDPTNDNALFNLGMVKWEAGHDAAGAVAAWAQLLKTHPNHPRRAQVEQWIARVRIYSSIHDPRFPHSSAEKGSAR